MKVSEALNAVGKIYVPGVVKFYESMPTNYWQDAHDSLEKAMLAKDNAVLEMAADTFVSTCAKLIAQYSSISKPSTDIGPNDAFIIGDEAYLKKWQSKTAKECFSCNSTTNLSLRSDPLNKALTYVVCDKCK